MNSIPDLTSNSLVGLWRRDRIEFANGKVDSSTKVFWGQTGSLYVDIRIPARAASLTPRESLAAYAAEELVVLAGQKGFAGHIRLQGQQCEWVRAIDYQPATGRPDKATVRIEGDTLYETGDSSSTLGASYREVFHRISQGNRACVAAQLVEADRSAIKSLTRPGAHVVILDEWFLFAEPHAHQLPAGPDLASLVGAATRQSACSYLNCEYSFGRLGPTDLHGSSNCPRFPSGLERAFSRWLPPHAKVKNTS